MNIAAWQYNGELDFHKKPVFVGGAWSLNMIIYQGGTEWSALRTDSRLSLVD